MCGDPMIFSETVADMLGIEKTHKNLLRVKRGIELADDVAEMTTHLFSCEHVIVSFQVCAYCDCDDYQKNNIDLNFFMKDGKTQAESWDYATGERKPFKPYYCKHLIAVIVYKEMHK